MKTLITLLALTLFSLTYAQNEPDKSINLALTEDAQVYGNESIGRGEPRDILYNPKEGNYATVSKYAEYGSGYKENLKDKVFEWGVKWKEPKLVNYITIGGVYPDQPQPDTAWLVSLFVNEDWQVIDYGVGGWIDGGIFEWKSKDMKPMEVTAMKVEVSGNGKDLISIHLRGRGGKAEGNDDSKTEPKATLIQYLPIEKPVNVAEDLIITIELLKEQLVKMKADIEANKKKYQILQERVSNLRKM